MWSAILFGQVRTGQHPIPETGIQLHFGKPERFRQTLAGFAAGILRALDILVAANSYPILARRMPGGNKQQYEQAKTSREGSTEHELPDVVR